MKNAQGNTATEYSKDDDKSLIKNGVIMEKAHRGAKAVNAARTTGEEIKDIAEQYKNCVDECTAGRIAEKFHEGTFNMDAARKGRPDLKARTTASNGQCRAKADIEVLKNGNIVDGAQVKYHNAPAATTFHISDPKYDGLQKICPSEQVAKVRELSGKRGKSGIGQRNYPDTAKKASDHLHHDGVKSDALSYDKALNMTKNPTKAAKEIFKKESLGAVKGGAIVGGAVSGVMSIGENIFAVVNGKKKTSDAIEAVAKDTVSGTIDGAAKSAASLGIQAGLVRMGAQTLARSSAPVAIGVTAVDVLRDAGLAISGKIDGEEFVMRSGKNVVKGSASWGGMEAGAALGTMICPGVGTIFLGILGAIGGGFLADVLVS